MKKKSKLQIGDTVHDLTILSKHHRDSKSRQFLLCRCICGNTKVIQHSLILCGNTKSCGCRVQRAAQKRRLPNNQGVINQIILGYKRHARNRNFAWRLTTNNVRHIIKKPCFYCGSLPSNIKITKNCLEGFIYSGIDRVNPKRGYFANNVVPCCSLCNRAKNNLTVGQFKEWGKKLSAVASQWGNL